MNDAEMEEFFKDFDPRDVSSPSPLGSFDPDLYPKAQPQEHTQQAQIWARYNGADYPVLKQPLPMNRAEEMLPELKIRGYECYSVRVAS